jgi:MFS family permease
LFRFFFIKGQYFYQQRVVNFRFFLDFSDKESLDIPFLFVYLSLKKKTEIIIFFEIYFKKVFPKSIPMNKNWLIKLRIIILSFILFFNTISTTYLYSFLPEMMVNLGMVYSISDSGGYASWMASGFFIGRFISATFWGYFIDKYGRKPGLLIILISVSICSILFGVSTNYYYALFIRLLTGFCNGLSIVGKTISTEICTDEFKSWSISVTNTIWALGGTVGPTIGSYFYQYIKSWPYLTSSIATAWIGTVLAILVYFFFEETLPSVKDSGKGGFKQFDKVNTSGISSSTEINSATVPQRQFDSMNKKEQFNYIMDLPNIPKLISIFSINTFYAAVLGELIPFWVAAKYLDGGLNFNYKDISEVYFYLTGPQLVLQIFLYPYIQGSKGDYWLLLVGHLVHIPMFFLLPLAHSFGSEARLPQKAWIVFWMFVRNFASFMNFAALQRLTNDAIDSDKRGKLNGIQLTFSSGLQIAAPILGGWLLSWSMKSYRVFPFDYHLVFYILTLMTIGAIFVIMRLKKTT